MWAAYDVDAVNGKRAGDPARVRLAELVAAQSLGVDPGFGQPMDTCCASA